MSTLGERLAEEIGELTLRKTAEVGLGHARANLPYIRKTIRDVTPDGVESGIVLSAGPSLHRRNPAQQITQSGYRGTIVATDGALGYCLRNGIVPQFVVSVDPHPDRIVRWFGDPDLRNRSADDYFQRQDLDPSFYENERRYNRELIDLVDRHGPKIRAILATSASPSVTRRCAQAGMELFWWNPLYDDHEQEASYSRQVYDLTGAPCMVTGGNTGSSAWVFALAVLKIQAVALVGMDLGYPPSLPIQNTQYYKELSETFGDRIEEAFIQVHNPYLNETWYADPTYYWYRQIFLEMVKHAPGETYNCTEGGILFGSGIRFVPLAEFLNQQSAVLAT